MMTKRAGGLGNDVWKVPEKYNGGDGRMLPIVLGVVVVPPSCVQMCDLWNFEICLLSAPEAHICLKS
eukprot:scaffold3130_cov79-Skeletonema_dohrnii-CCMP3373.AAC.3